MSYITDFENELEKRFLSLEKIWREEDIKRYDEEISAVIKFVKDKVLESYRNGSERPGSFKGGRTFPQRKQLEARRS